MTFDDPVAFARRLLQGVAAGYSDLHAFILDQTALPQLVRGNGHSRPRDAQHVGKKVMRDRNAVAVHPVGAKAQPSGEPLFNAVLGIAARGLHGLDQLRLNVAQCQMMKFRRPVELRFRCLDRALETSAAQLHIHPVKTAPGAHECRDAEHRLKPEHADLNLGTVLKGRGHRSDSLLDEVHMADGLTRKFEFMVNGQHDLARRQPPDHFSRQILQEFVPILWVHADSEPGIEPNHVSRCIRTDWPNRCLRTRRSSQSSGS